MKKMSVTHKQKLYLIWVLMWVWVAYTSCTTKANYEGLPRNPLEGSKQSLPGDVTGNTNYQDWSAGGVEYVYYGDDNLTRMLDVGACMTASDSNISYVPPLDGTRPVDTLCQDQYAMKFVLFDLQLVDLKSVDPIGGSFQAEFQMVLHWVDTVIKGSNGTNFTDDCSFACDTESPSTLCCDSVWVPPLHLPTCNINKVQSSTPPPYTLMSLSSDDCFVKGNEGKCIWRRLWYLNIDVTCDSQMDFHNFPFDVQSLTIDILNPYASRTWFQLTKGFLQQNINEDINSVNLSPDAKIPGWTMNEVKVSSTCGTSENWKQTFLTQNSLLGELIDSIYQAEGVYQSQYEEIMSTLSLKTLQCPHMEDLNNSNEYDDSASIFNYEPYKKARDMYEERVISTLKQLKQCIKEKGTPLPWSMSMYENKSINISNFSSYYSSVDNNKRSFNILDLEGGPNKTKVSSLCAILAVVNLTTQGIQISILVQRYRIFYVIKLILPTVACVAFSFAAFGLQPKELMGRLTVVVPSAIALTALQSLVVSTDIPPVAYMAPTTFIFLVSYIVQLIISFESVYVSWSDSQGRLAGGHAGPVPDAPSINKSSRESFGKLVEGVDDQINETKSDRRMNSLEIETLNATQGSTSHHPKARIDDGPPQECHHTQEKQKICEMNATRKFDLIFMYVLSAIYAVVIVLCCIISLVRSQSFKMDSNSVLLWPP